MFENQKSRETLLLNCARFKWPLLFVKKKNMAQTEKINHVMMRGATWCSAAGCFNNKGTNPTLSFFRFPKDAER